MRLLLLALVFDLRRLAMGSSSSSVVGSLFVDFGVGFGVSFSTGFGVSVKFGI